MRSDPLRSRQGLNRLRGLRGGLRAPLIGAAVALGAVAVGVAGPGAVADAADDLAYLPFGTWSSQPPAVYEPLAWPSGHAAGGVGISSDGSVLAVTDRTEHAIRLYDASGRPSAVVGSSGSGPGRLSSPRDVDVFDDGSIAVSDTGNNRVQILDGDGVPLVEWPVADPRGLQVVRDWVYVVSRQEKRVIAFDREGRVKRAIDLSDQLTAPEGLVYRGDVPGNAVPPDALFDVADPERGRLYTVYDGASRATQVLSGLPGLQTGTEWRDEESRYWLAAVPGTAHGLVVANGGGLVMARVSFTDATDLEMSPDGTLYAAVAPDGLVRVGDLRAVLDQETDTFGRLIEPRRIAIGDRVVIGDGAPRVQEWSLAGRAMKDLTFLDGGPLAGGVPGVQPIPDDDANAPADVAASGANGYVLWHSGRIRRIDGESFRDMWQPQSSESRWITSISAHGDRVAAFDLATQEVIVLDAGLSQVDTWAVESDDFLGVADIALTHDRVYLIDQSRHVLEARSQTGHILATTSLVSKPERVAADPDGNAFVLTRAGWVAAYSPTGEALGAWPLGSSGARPTDLALDAHGRLYVTDAEGLIRLYEASDSAPTGQPGSVGDGQCGAIAYKAAQPPEIEIGDTVEVQLVVDGSCPQDEAIADVVLVIDRSGSMTGAKIQAAKSSAVDFVTNLYGRRSRLGVVAFSNGAEQVQALTEDRSASVRGIASLTAGGTTNIVEGLAEAIRTVREAEPRPESRQVIVFLSDGRHSVSTPIEWLDDLITAVRDDDITVFTIGLGTDADRLTLGRMATDPSHYYFSPSAEELADIYEQIAGRIGTSELFRAVTVTDVVPENMTYLAGTGEPVEPEFDEASRTLIWELGRVIEPGFRLSYRLRPDQGGLWPTNVKADAQYYDGQDRYGRLPFPVPFVRVHVPYPTRTPTVTPSPTPTPTLTPTVTPSPTPTDTPTPTPTPSPTVTPTPVPRPIYMPMLHVERCRARDWGTDVVLVVDSSSSMEGRTEPYGPSKLGAAVAAAGLIVDYMDFPMDRVGVVQFNDQAAVLTAMTDDWATARIALQRVTMQPGTRIDAGVAAAHQVLAEAPQREGSRPVVVLLTDGRPTRSRATQVITAAERLKATGAVLYTVGLGPDADPDLLLLMASSVGTHYHSPGTGELARIYRDIAQQIICR